MKIKDINIKGKVVLGPMAGITSLAYRDHLKSFGVGLSFTEMVSDCGVIYSNEKTLEYIKTSSCDRPVGIQLFGNKEENVVSAMNKIIKIHDNFDFFDINLGCPVSKVTGPGAGSSLLKDSNRLKEFISYIVKHSPKPVTAKIRLGWDENSINVFENIKVLEEAGVCAITIHARTKKQMYSGNANYEILRDVGDKMSVPLIISGDIFTLQNAIDALQITKADFVMVARGGVGNPFLVKQINTYFETGEILQSPTVEENISFLLEYCDQLIEEKGEFLAMRILRGIAPKFLSGYPGYKDVKHTIAQTINTKNDLIKILKDNNLIKIK